MITEISVEYAKNMIKAGKRFDDRGFEDLRELKIERGYVQNAEGSAMVTLGGTKILVGVKMQVGEPFSDSPEKGVLMVNAELGPIASPDFESGPPNPRSVELARVVDRGIRESKAINTEKLCIEPGEKVWMICVDIHVLNDDGNLIDASSIGAIAALLDAKVPKLNEDGTLNRENMKEKLEVTQIPVACTVHKIADKIILDPNLREESAVEGRLTVTSMDGERLCALQKGGECGFTPEEVYKAIDISIKKGEEIRKKYVRG
jgi:exosome complex component RRP42